MRLLCLYRGWERESLVGGRGIVYEVGEMSSWIQREIVFSDDRVTCGVWVVGNVFPGLYVGFNDDKNNFTQELKAPHQLFMSKQISFVTSLER